MHLFQYLEENSFNLEEEREHKLLLNDISNRSMIIAGSRHGKIYREVMLKPFDKPNIIGCVDLVIPTDLELILIEAKVCREKRPKGTRSLINQQLRKNYRFFKEYFSIAPRIFGVYRKEGTRSNFHHYELPRPEEDSSLYVRKLGY